MKPVGFLAGAAALGVAMVVSAPIARADDFSGTYAFTAPAQGYTQGFATTWTVTPCGEDCRHITTPTGATDTDAHREGPYWVFFRYADPGVECPGNQYVMTRTKRPATLRYTVNPDTLVGQFQPEGTPCGGTPMPSRFSLAKVG
ncbi:hypothetical protein KIH27_12710 [Mycobacterium sp. M1]|uniref:Lipoprotein n=1 Tax=Mycolicibacter acidiphilus TaxID=2835306 RepID=A0ABS5RK81_9MYCO|nr:hypothetical protein [Mycolicibacter acidiphilus]MBS9534447.1 hypothetical protein [Mycolicibacter acidiphilus]